MEEELFLTEIQLTEAMSGPHSNEWLEAICKEMKIFKNENWVMMDRPKNHKVIGSRILCNKYRQDGTIDRRKDRRKHDLLRKDLHKNSESTSKNRLRQLHAWGR